MSAPGLKIEFHGINSVSLGDFAMEHGLVMDVSERPASIMRQMNMSPNARFYAQFKGSEIKEGGCLRGGYGNGATPEATILAYIPEIEGRLLVFNAFGRDRKEVYAPAALHFLPASAAKPAEASGAEQDPSPASRSTEAR